MAKKNAAAVSLGKRRMAKLSEEERSELGQKGGAVGGPKRAEKLTPARRKAIAKKAAAKRWGKTT